jgi:hypothetical protein
MTTTGISDSISALKTESLNSPNTSVTSDNSLSSHATPGSRVINSIADTVDRIEHLGRGIVSPELYDSLLKAGTLDPDLEPPFQDTRSSLKGDNVNNAELEVGSDELIVNPTESGVYVADSEGNVLANIRSSEYKILTDSGLSPEIVNGRVVFKRDDIDSNYKDAMGQTNSERMREGKPPLDPSTGRPIELHHVGQEKDGALAELRMEEHRTPPNNSILHPNRNGSEVEHGNEWNHQRAEHWKARAESMGVDS